MDDPEPCDGIGHAWRVLSREEVAERYPGETRSVAVTGSCGVVKFWDGVEWRVGIG